MSEYFVVAKSFAAPVFSDTCKGFVQGEATRMAPEDALLHYAANYKHPCGLYAAALYADANAYHRGDPPLAKWLCNHEKAKREATSAKSSYSYFGHGPEDFEIDLATWQCRGRMNAAIAAERKGGCDETSD